MCGGGVDEGPGLGATVPFLSSDTYYGSYRHQVGSTPATLAVRAQPQAKGTSRQDLLRARVMPEHLTPSEPYERKVPGHEDAHTVRPFCA